jgi:energy-coupling factor transporter ATP-binding protein EcfA2
VNSEEVDKEELLLVHTREYLDKVFNYRQFKKILFLLKNNFLIKRIRESLFDKVTKIRNFFSPPGYFLVLLGPDGVGKTTTAKILNKLLKDINIKSHHFHLGVRPGILPLKKTSSHNKKRREKAKKQEKTCKFIEFLKYNYHFLDYLFFYFFRIRPLIAKGGIVIVERYFSWKSRSSF